MAIITLQEFIERRKDDREPLLNFKWHCVSLPFDFDTDYVESVNLPFPSLNVKPLFGGAKTTYYPGFLELSAFDVTFYEDSAARTRRFLKMWQERIRDPKDGFYYLPPNYKRDMVFELLDTRNQPVMTAKMKGCWPTQSNAWDLVSNGSERLTVQQNFATDGMEYLETDLVGMTNPTDFGSFV